MGKLSRISLWCCMLTWAAFLFNIYIYIIFFFGCSGSSMLCGLFSSYSEQGLLSSCSVLASHCGGFAYYTAWALRCARAGFGSCGTWVQRLQFLGSTIGAVDVVLWRNFSAVHGILPNQRSNPCLPRWQVDSLPLSHQGSLSSLFLAREVIWFKGQLHNLFISAS